MEVKTPEDKALLCHFMQPSPPRLRPTDARPEHRHRRPAVGARKAKAPMSQGTASAARRALRNAYLPGRGSGGMGAPGLAGGSCAGPAAGWVDTPS